MLLQMGTIAILFLRAILRTFWCIKMFIVLQPILLSCCFELKPTRLLQQLYWGWFLGGTVASLPLDFEYLFECLFVFKFILVIKFRLRQIFALLLNVLNIDLLQWYRLLANCLVVKSLRLFWATWLKVWLKRPWSFWFHWGWHVGLPLGILLCFVQLCSACVNDSRRLWRFLNQFK